MTKKEIEAYKANFEYGRKCWLEFIAEHPPNAPPSPKPERKVEGDPPF